MPEFEAPPYWRVRPNPPDGWFEIGSVVAWCERCDDRVVVGLDGLPVCGCSGVRVVNLRGAGVS